MVIPRSYMLRGKVMTDKLILISSNSKISKPLIADLHTHMSSILYELGNMFQQGYFILKTRKLFKSFSSKCVICRKLRQVACERKMGPSWQLQSALKNPPMTVCSMDCAGYFKVKIHNTKGKFRKLFVLLLTCFYT